MAFNPYYQNPYQPMGYNGQYGNYAPQNAAGAPQAFGCQITRVNGRNGADAFRMAPNSSILLMDENDPIVWMKQTDGAGYATVTPYTVSPYQAAPPVDVSSLEERVKRLEDTINGKSNDANADGKRKPKAEYPPCDGGRVPKICSEHDPAKSAARNRAVTNFRANEQRAVC